MSLQLGFIGLDRLTEVFANGVDVTGSGTPMRLVGIGGADQVRRALSEGAELFPVFCHHDRLDDVADVIARSPQVVFTVGGQVQEGLGGHVRLEATVADLLDVLPIRLVLNDDGVSQMPLIHDRLPSPHTVPGIAAPTSSDDTQSHAVQNDAVGVSPFMDDWDDHIPAPITDDEDWDDLDIPFLPQPDHEVPVMPSSQQHAAQSQPTPPAPQMAHSAPIGWGTPQAPAAQPVPSTSQPTPQWGPTPQPQWANANADAPVLPPSRQHAVQSQPTPPAPHKAQPAPTGWGTPQAPAAQPTPQWGQALQPQWAQPQAPAPAEDHTRAGEFWDAPVRPVIDEQTPQPGSSAPQRAVGQEHRPWHPAPQHPAPSPASTPAPPRPAPSPTPAAGSTTNALNPDCQVIIVWGGRGGPGKSSTSQCLAATAAHFGKRTILVDANLGQADQRLLIGIPPRVDLPNIYDAAISGNPLDALCSPKQLQDHRPHKETLIEYALAPGAPASLVADERVSPALYYDVICALTQYADVIVVDTQILEARATEMFTKCLHPLWMQGAWGVGVSDQSTPGMRHLIDILHDFGRNDMPSHRQLAVMNKFRPEVEISVQHFASLIKGRARFIGVMPDDADVARTYNAGESLLSQPAMAHVIETILHLVIGTSITSAPPPSVARFDQVEDAPKRGLLSRIIASLRGGKR